MKKVVWKYGLIAGLILTAMVITSIIMLGDSHDFERGESLGYLFMVGSFTMIFLGIREYRDKHSGGMITFNTGFRIGILITLIASVCYALTWMVYLNFTDNDFMEKYTAYFIEQLQSSGKPAVEIEKEIAAFKSNMTEYRHPLVMSLFTLLEVFPVGLIITILCALLMKKKPA